MPLPPFPPVVIHEYGQRSPRVINLTEHAPGLGYVGLAPFKMEILQASIERRCVGSRIPALDLHIDSEVWGRAGWRDRIRVKFAEAGAEQLSNDHMTLVQWVRSRLRNMVHHEIDECLLDENGRQFFDPHGKEPAR